MKLKNKKTGEIGNLVLNINPNRESYSVLSTENGDTVCGNLVLADYDSLAELNEEWEDYEEPKVGYIIDPMEEDYMSADDSGYEESDVERAKELGIWLETKEEAEKAVEKLKAWKRLKDKGAKVIGYYCDGGTNTKGEFSGEVNFTIDVPQEVNIDLFNLLFGGEE